MSQNTPGTFLGVPVLCIEAHNILGSTLESAYSGKLPSWFLLLMRPVICVKEQREYAAQSFGTCKCVAFRAP